MPIKKFLIVLGILVALFVCITTIKDRLLKSVVTTAASKITGSKVHIDGFSSNIFNSTIHISGLKIYNPSGFPDGVMVFCPEINLIYDRAALLKKDPHFYLMDIDLKEIELTHNKEGKLNVDELNILQRPKPATPAPLKIDLLTLRIGKIIHKDYANGKEPDVRAYDVNSHNSYTSILTAKQLVTLIFVEPMKIVAIKKAGVFGVAEVTGVSMMRVAAQATIIGKDNVQETIDASFEKLYDVSLEVAKRMGTITKDDAPNGAIKANINGAMVALQLRKKADDTTEITISARKLLFPKLDIAGGVLYQIVDQLQSLESDG